jgi:hypothetical protein
MERAIKSDGNYQSIIKWLTDNDANYEDIIVYICSFLHHAFCYISNSLLGANKYDRHME